MNSRVFKMADRHVFGGKLAGWLSAQRKAGRTIDQITGDLVAKGVEVSRETVRKWIKVTAA